MEKSKYNFKVVLMNSRNDDQDLMGLYETEMQAQSAKPKIFAEHSRWVKNVNNLIVKPIDPERIFMPVCTDYMHYVFSLIPSEEWQRVMKSDASAEIHANSLMCGGETYYYLSRMIPKDWTVVDIGAAYGAQSYLFQNHAKYIAVEPYVSCEGFRIENFKANGTERYDVSAGKFINEILPTLNLDLKKTFAIANYIPNWFGENPIELTRQTFPNCYTYYPA